MKIIFLIDIVRIVEFYNRWPVVSVLYRTGQLLNIRGENVPESTLYDVLLKSIAEISRSGDEIYGMTDFTCCESVFLDSHPELMNKDKHAPYYVIFVELFLTANEELLDKEASLRLSESVS